MVLEDGLSSDELAVNAHTWRHIWNVQRFFTLAFLYKNSANTLPSLMEDACIFYILGKTISRDTNDAFVLGKTCKQIESISKNTEQYVKSYVKQIMGPAEQAVSTTTIFSSIIRMKLLTHDQSKLVHPEVKTFTEFTSKLKDCKFGSDEYKGYLEQMKPALDNHYALNCHHPEHYKNGIVDMTFFDVFEMVCDWAASSLRTKNGSFQQSLAICKERFGISDALADLIQYTYDVVLDEEYQVQQNVFGRQDLVKVEK